MKETLLLTKTFLKNGFRSSDKGKFKVGAYIFLTIYFSIVTTYISIESLKVLKNIMLESLFIQIIILMDIMLICIQSVVSSINMFYFSDDIEYVLPLPIKIKNLYYSKLNVLIFSEYIFEILFFLAPFCYYGIAMNLGCIYFVKMIAFMILLPIILCSLISFVTVRAVGIFKGLKNKDTDQYISMRVSIIFVNIVTTLSFGETRTRYDRKRIIRIYNENGNYNKYT